MGDYKRELGRRIKQRREELGLFQQDLAEYVNMDRSTVAGWEAGRRMPDLETLDKLEELLGDLKRKPTVTGSATAGRRQLRGLLRAQGATQSDIKTILDLLDMRAAKRNQTDPSND